MRLDVWQVSLDYAWPLSEPPGFEITFGPELLHPLGHADHAQFRPLRSARNGREPLHSGSVFGQWPTAVVFCEYVITLIAVFDTKKGRSSRDRAALESSGVDT